MHDKNGTELKQGDIVLVPMKVTDLQAGEEYCNVCLESVHGRRPDNQKEFVSAVNTGVLVLFDRETENKEG